MNYRVTSIARAMVIGLAIGLATKNWEVGLALTIAFTLVPYSKKTKQRTQC